MLSNRHISQNYCRNTRTCTLQIFSAKGNGQDTGVDMLINKMYPTKFGKALRKVITPCNCS